MLLCVTALVMLFITASSFAVPVTVCTPYAGTGPITLRLAVAANFAVPAETMVNNFLASDPSYPTTYNVWICPNSTGVLVADIDNNPRYFDMFFAANEAAHNLPRVRYTAFTYAKGIPIIFGYTPRIGIDNPVNNANALIHGLPPATDFEMLPYSTLSSYSINTTTAKAVAIADPLVAPYGQAAELIMAALGHPSPRPVTLATLNTVTEVQTYVGTDTTISGTPFSIISGFASKAQFCASGYIDPITDVPTGIAYVAFTNDVYTLDQTAVQLTRDANDLRAYIRTAMGTNAWNTFLTSKCYGAL